MVMIMNLFLVFIFIFFIGSTVGWLIELIYRRIAHKKWVNPGFLVGPYLPIYGFGLCALTLLHINLLYYDFSIILVAIIMCTVLTIIELFSGLLFLKFCHVKLWDYIDCKLNYKGIICPLYSFFWTILGLLYYYFLADYMLEALNWFSQNLSFSFVLGIFFGTITIDIVTSTKLLVKLKKFAKENEIEIKYEEFKNHIHDFQKQTMEKYSFLFPFKGTKPLKDYLSDYASKK